MRSLSRKVGPDVNLQMLIKESIGQRVNLQAVRPKREIEAADPELFRFLSASISEPFLAFSRAIEQAIQTIIECVALVYVRPDLPEEKTD